jgi:DNA-binding NarL/FixJ family response regulator
MDLRLPGIDGLETFKKLKEINPLVKVIFVSVVTRKESVDAAKQMGVKNYVYKPITEEKLISAVKAA